MDSRTSVQDIYRCELCKGNMVDMFCVECQRKLCKACVGNHLGDDPSRHILVKYEDRNTTLVFPTCPTHLTERCKNFCQECDKAVCPSCISSDSHRKHFFLKISEVFERQKENINIDSKKLEEILFPLYTSIVQEEEADAAKLEDDYKILKQSIENQRTMWHEEIEKIANMLQDETDKMRDIQLKALNKHIQKVRKIRTGIHEAIKLNKDLLESQNVTKTLGYKSSKSALKSLPEKLVVSIPKFISQPINRDLIAEMFGVTVGFSIFKQIKENNQIIHITSKRWKQLLDEPKVQSAIETEMGCLDKLACQSNGKLWVAGKKGLLKLFKFDTPLDVAHQSSGATGTFSILKQFNVDKGPTEIAVAKTGDLIYGIKLESTIFILKQDKAEILINLYGWKLLSFCVTDFDELLVCITDERKYRCRVVRFNQSSEERQIIQYDYKGKSLYSPGILNKCIRENQNGDICLADCDAGAVIVTDRAGQLRFRYDGKTSFQNNAPFRPVGIATDSNAHILVSDSLKIHIIEENGQFLRFLDIVCSNPLRLALDEDDNLYIADTYGNVKVVRYTETVLARAWRFIKAIFQ